MGFYALVIGLGLATGGDSKRERRNSVGFYALVIGLGLATDAFGGPLDLRVWQVLR